MIIDCDTCVMRSIGCADCVVTALLPAPSEDSGSGLRFDTSERAALDVLAASGLLPPLRLVPTWTDPGKPVESVGHPTRRVDRLTDTAS